MRVLRRSSRRLGPMPVLVDPSVDGDGVEPQQVAPLHERDPPLGDQSPHVSLVDTQPSRHLLEIDQPLRSLHVGRVGYLRLNGCPREPECSAQFSDECRSGASQDRDRDRRRDREQDHPEGELRPQERRCNRLSHVALCRAGDSGSAVGSTLGVVRHSEWEHRGCSCVGSKRPMSGSCGR